MTNAFARTIRTRFSRRFACAVALLLTAAFGAVAAGQPPVGARGPAFVDITWLSISKLSRDGVRPIANDAVKRALGF